MPGLLENDLPAQDRQLVDRDGDPHAWALRQAALLRHPSGPGRVDDAAPAQFLEEWADEMLAAGRSHPVNLMARAATAALSRNPDAVGHLRSECVEFHDRLIDAYRPSMRARIDMPALWKRACRSVLASFADHGEPAPPLPAEYPFSFEEPIDANLDWLVGQVTRRG